MRLLGFRNPTELTKRIFQWPNSWEQSVFSPYDRSKMDYLGCYRTKCMIIYLRHISFSYLRRNDNCNLSCGVFVSWRPIHASYISEAPKCDNLNGNIEALTTWLLMCICILHPSNAINFNKRYNIRRHIFLQKGKERISL